MGRRREDVPYQGMGGRGCGWGGQREGSTGSLRGREIRTWGSKKKNPTPAYLEWHLRGRGLASLDVDTGFWPLFRKGDLWGG